MLKIDFFVLKVIFSYKEVSASRQNLILMLNFVLYEFSTIKIILTFNN